MGEKMKNKKIIMLAFPKFSINPFIFEVKKNYGKRLMKKLRGIRIVKILNKRWWDWE